MIPSNWREKLNNNQLGYSVTIRYRALTCLTWRISLVTLPSKIVPSIKYTGISLPCTLSRPTSRVVSTSWPRCSWLSSTATKRTRCVHEGMMAVQVVKADFQFLKEARQFNMCYSRNCTILMPIPILRRGCFFLPGNPLVIAHIRVHL